MSQKFIKSKNKNSFSQAFGKYFATAVYDNHFIGTEELSEFIQRQASVKKSDIKAVLQELGEAFKHFFEMGQKIKLDGIGIFKVGFSSIGVNKLEDCGAQTITTRRVLFHPETTRVIVGQQKMSDGTVKQKYVNAITMLKDVVFEETHDNAMNVESESNTNPSNGTNSGGSSNSGNNGGNSGNSGTVNPAPSNPESGNGTGSETPSVPKLTISRSGSGSSTVSVNGNSVSSGAEIAANTEVSISVTPAEGATPTATLNGSSITLTESEGAYTGSFQMPSANATLAINTGGASTGGGDAN